MQTLLQDRHYGFHMRGKNRAFTAIAVMTVLTLAVSGSVLSVSSHRQNQTIGPTVQLPAPTGKLAVGRTAFHWIDTTRGEGMTDESLILPFGDANAKAANRRRTQIIREFTLAFFQQSLKHRNSTLLNGSTSDYPEVVVERFSPSQP